MGRDADTDAGGAAGADEVQDVVLDQAQEDELLLDAFEEELQFGEEDSAEFDNPDKKKTKPKAEATGEDDDAGDDDDQDGDEDDEDDDEADASAAKTKAKDAEEGEDPDGDFVEDEGGKKIAVRDLLEAHKFKNEVGATVDQIRTNYEARATKELETFKTASAGKLKELEDGLALVQALVPKLEKPPATMLDESHEDYNPDGYHFLLRAYDEFQATLARARGIVEKANGERTQETEAKTKAAVADNLRKLLEKAPELKDQAKAKAFEADLRKTLKADGFSDEEINGLTDHRMILIARDAMLYRAAKAQGAPKVEGEKRKPRLVRSSGRTTPSPDKRGVSRSREAVERVKRTGKVRESDLEGYWGKFID